MSKVKVKNFLKFMTVGYLSNKFVTISKRAQLLRALAIENEFNHYNDTYFHNMWPTGCQNRMKVKKQDQKFI